MRANSTRSRTQELVEWAKRDLDQNDSELFDKLYREAQRRWASRVAPPRIMIYVKRAVLDLRYGVGR